MFKAVCKLGLEGHRKLDGPHRSGPSKTGSKSKTKKLQQQLALLSRPSTTSVSTLPAPSIALVRGRHSAKLIHTHLKFGGVSVVGTVYSVATPSGAARHSCRFLDQRSDRRNRNS